MSAPTSSPSFCAFSSSILFMRSSGRKTETAPSVSAGPAPSPTARPSRPAPLLPDHGSHEQPPYQPHVSGTNGRNCVLTRSGPRAGGGATAKPSGIDGRAAESGGDLTHVGVVP